MAVTRASEAVQDWLRTDDHTQTELAELVSKLVGRDVRQSTISAIARGEATPRGDIMAALSTTLGIDIAWWLPNVADQTGPQLVVSDADAVKLAAGS